MNIALFGTSADPPTQGHGKVLAWLSAHYSQVAVWAADNPFKQHQASFEHRNAMLRALIAALNGDNVSLDPELSDRRSLITVERAQRRWPQATLTLVVGSDLVAQLPSWYQAEKLLSQVKLLVVPRPGTPLSHGSLLPLQAVGAEVTIAEMEGLDVSSTAFRNSCKRIGSDRTLDELLAPAVRDYVYQHGLYRCGDRQLVQH